MPQIRISFLPPEYWQDFQQLVLEVAKREWPEAKCSAFGREGQGQDGIDVLVTRSNGETIGVQAKKRRLFDADGRSALGGNLSPNQVKAMVEEAEKFEPTLHELIIATTALTDATLQKSVTRLSDERRHKGRFTVGIWFWEDFQRHLNWDGELQRLYYGDWVEKTFGYTQEKHYLMMLRCAFNRPAFTTRLEIEDSGDDMAQALSDTQAAITTGILKDRRGNTIQRAPIALNQLTDATRENLEKALRSLDEARKSYRSGVKYGELENRRHDVFTSDSRGRNYAQDVDRLRADALDLVNAALRSANIEELGNYLRPSPGF